ncbi:MAG TPA: NAD-dependent epimerase/dehydratase family protein [Euzebya sp.]|nr:NAD-dependent epimerase/dehydratase family protein [Euzebya sp.]
MPSTVAVVGVSSPVGRATLSRLARSEGLDRVIAIDPDSPDMPPGRVELRTMDARDRLLPLAMDGVDVLVHGAFQTDPAASPDSLYGANVGGTRNVLAAASKAGVRHLVLLGDAVAYGAHHDNPLPLSEDSPLRANPGFAYGYHWQLIEELVQEWAQAHPAAIVTRLRVAPVMGGGDDPGLVRRLQSPRLLVPVGMGAPWQFVHVDDVAAAVELVITDGIAGVFNVAADGWLSAAEVATYLDRPVLEVPHATMAEGLRRANDLHLSPLPPEAMPYLLHPCVLDNDALRRHGWHATRSNREMIATFATEHADDWAFGRVVVSRRRVRRATVGATLLAALAVWQLLRRRKGGSRPRQPDIP